MKIFAVYARLNFTKKPDWLDGFIIKYNYPYTYHVTLKQPMYIQEEKIANIKNILTDFFNKFELSEHKIDIVFDKLVIGSPIMIEATDKREISILQDKIVTALKSYTNFVKPESKDWEEDFKPHITITADLEGEKLEQAKLDIGNDVRCEATIEEIVLSVVDEITPEQANDPKNKTTFAL